VWATPGESQVSVQGVQKIINIKKKIICNIIKSYKSYKADNSGERNGEMKMRPENENWNENMAREAGKSRWNWLGKMNNIWAMDIEII